MYAFPLTSPQETTEPGVAPGRPTKPEGFDEVQSRFTRDFDFASLFGAYQFRCAFTGEDLKPAFDIDPHLATLSLLSLDAPQDLRADLLLPACQDAIYAYERGHLSVGVWFNILVDLSRIDRQLAARLNGDGKLRLPASQDYWPNQLVLKQHREAYAAALFDPD